MGFVLSLLFGKKEVDEREIIENCYIKCIDENGEEIYKKPDNNGVFKVDGVRFSFIQ